MTKACGRCGRIHPHGYHCTAGQIYRRTDERKLRNTNKWHKKSEEIREEAQYLCEVCRAEGRYTYNNLEVHHITPLKEDETKLLDNDNLICLCADCHKRAEKGELSRDYLTELARVRPQRYPPGGQEG